MSLLDRAMVRRCAVGVDSALIDRGLTSISFPGAPRVRVVGSADEAGAALRIDRARGALTMPDHRSAHADLAHAALFVINAAVDADRGLAGIAAVAERFLCAVGVAQTSVW